MSVPCDAFSLNGKTKTATSVALPLPLWCGGRRAAGGGGGYDVAEGCGSALFMARLALHSTT